MTNPLVSVITTVSNCEKFIEESIKSIFDQTFRDFELIIYDDCSTDNTLKIVEDVLKKFEVNHVIKTPFVGERVGCGEGRNKAIQEASGKYLAIQDGDDISFQNRLQKEVEFLEENQDIFCVSSWADVIDEQGDFIEIFNYPPAYHKKIKKEIFEKKNNPIIDPASMFRRDIFNKLGGYDKKWGLVPDFNLWIRAMKEGYKFANIQEVLIHYRKHSGSVTNKYKMDVVKEHYKMCRDLFN